MKIEELLPSIEVEKIYNESPGLEISGIAYHSEKVEEGDLFVCVKGYKTDGHKYLGQAIANGAVAAVVEEVQEEFSIPQIVVPNARIALATLACEYYGNPSLKLDMIGITASNGKTTTSFMTNAILEEEGYKTGLIGTVAVRMGDVSIPSVLTTPESLDLQYYLSEMVKRDITHVCMEVSSNAMEAHRVEGVDYDIIAFNNVTREHIDFHGTYENYLEVKSSIVRNASAKSFVVLNVDDPFVASLANQTEATVVTYGVENHHADLICKDLDLSTGRAKYTVEVRKPLKRFPFEIEPCEFRIELSVPGLHSVYNSMSALTIGLLSGVSIPAIQRALKKFRGVERRFEFIYEDDEFIIIDDHFANAGNINVTLKTLKFMDFKNLRLVYAIRGSRGKTVNRENAEAIAEWSKKLGVTEIIATKSVSHVTEKDWVTDEEEAVFLEVLGNAGINVLLYDELEDAIRKAIELVNPGDLILLGGAQGMDYGAEIALEIVKELKPDIPDDVLFAPLVDRVAGVTNRHRRAYV